MDFPFFSVIHIVMDMLNAVMNIINVVMTGEKGNLIFIVGWVFYIPRAEGWLYYTQWNSRMCPEIEYIWGVFSTTKILVLYRSLLCYEENNFQNCFLETQMTHLFLAGFELAVCNLQFAIAFWWLVNGLLYYFQRLWIEVALALRQLNFNY